MSASALTIQLIDNLLRLVRHAIELHKPVLMLNVGPTRADEIPGIEKIELTSGAVLRDVVRAVQYVSLFINAMNANAKGPMQRTGIIS